MPYETNVVRRLYVLGFRSIGEPGVSDVFTSTDGRICIQLDRSKHLALSTDRVVHRSLRDEFGSVYVH